MLLLLLAVFVGLGGTVLSVVQGHPSSASTHTAYRDRSVTVAPIVVLLSLVLVLGMYVPPPLAALLHDAARTMGGQSMGGQWW